jgi:hypothetical protein
VVELDEEGLVEGPGCRGEVCVELRHAGYVPAEPWILEPDDPKVLHARALGRLEGEVVDASGNAVVAATVVATAVPGDDPIGVLPFTNGATTSDEDGTFSLAWIDRPPCDPCRERTGDCDGDDRPLPVLDRVQLSARAEGHGPAETIVELDEVGDAPVRIELPPAAAPIRGTLSDPEGAGYPRAFVLARSVDRPAEQHRADVDADGGFAVTGLGDGTYDLRAIQDGVALARESGVAAGEEVALVGPAQRDLVVEVVDDEGRVVPQAEVRGPPFGTARTDAQGRVQAAGVAAGAYTLRIRPRRQPVGVHTIEVARGADLPDAPQITRIRAPRTSER